MRDAVTVGDEEFLAAILRHPAEDLHRLAYADWLEEHADDPCKRCGGRRDWHDALTGDGRCYDCRGTGTVPDGRKERAEFIRVQVELARDDAADVRNGRLGTNPLRKRERELFQFHGTAWAFRPDDWENRCCSIEGRDTPAVLFRRGFVDEIVCPWACWLAHADRLMKECPLTRLTLTDRPAYSGSHNHATRTVRYWLNDLPDAPHVQIDLLTLQWNKWRDLKPVEELVARAFPGIAVTMPAEDHHYTLPFGTPSQ